MVNIGLIQFFVLTSIFLLFTGGCAPTRQGMSGYDAEAAAEASFESSLAGTSKMGVPSLANNPSEVADAYSKSAKQYESLSDETDDPDKKMAFQSASDAMKKYQNYFQKLPSAGATDFSKLIQAVKENESAKIAALKASNDAANAELTALKSYYSQRSKQVDIYGFISSKYGYYKVLYTNDIVGSLPTLHKDQYFFAGRMFSVYNQEIDFGNGVRADQKIYFCYIADNRTSGVYSHFMSPARESCGAGYQIRVAGYVSESRHGYASGIQLYRARFYSGGWANDWLLAPDKNVYSSQGWFDDATLGYPTP